jgi:DNA-binding winged helix-turn-helix (wHTH) protein
MHGREPIAEELRRAPGLGEHLSFGEFELEVDTGELRRNGERVALQPQPAQVLQLLAERAGTLVTRSRLQEELWGAAAAVDAEQGLNYCILQIRRALDDDAESPRFVETIPRRGYRFLHAVQRHREAVPQVSAHRAPRRRLLPSVALVLALALVVAAAWFVASGREASPPRLTILPLRGSGASEAAAVALTEELLSQLVARYGDQLEVVAGSRSAPSEGEIPSRASHYLLGGTVLPAEDGLRSVVWLERLPDHLQLLSATYELSAGPEDRARCARRVVDDLAARLGLAASSPTPP